MNIDEVLIQISPILSCGCGASARFASVEGTVVFWCDTCEIRLAKLDESV